MPNTMGAIRQSIFASEVLPPVNNKRYCCVGREQENSCRTGRGNSDWLPQTVRPIWRVAQQRFAMNQYGHNFGEYSWSQNPKSSLPQKQSHYSGSASVTGQTNTRTPPATLKNLSHLE